MPGSAADGIARWDSLYREVPLCTVPSHFAGMTGSPFLRDYLIRVLQLCPRGGRTCETGVGSGYGAVWLSLRGVRAEGIDYSPAIVERAGQVNNIIQGSASFRVGDLFRFYNGFAPRYEVVHHQGVLEHFTVPQVHAALAQQVASARWVVFSVPSAYYPFDPEFGDERMMPLAEWERILAPFQVEELRYYGDPQLGGREQILAVIRGQPADDTLCSLMRVSEEPYPEGISAIVHTRNEAHQIAECIRTLQGWTDEIIVCDMESADRTVAIARELTPEIVSHPPIANFDRARNVSAMRARYRWVFYLDADERVPPELGHRLRELTRSPGCQFEALLPPFRHYFSGHWMQCLYPGYTAPRLFKNGRFHFNARLHSGAEVDGTAIPMPHENPALALEHRSFASLSHYLEKLNRYTDGEADNLFRDGRPFHWQIAVREFVRDFQMYYRGLGAGRDGVHGFLYSFLSGFYRFHQYGKLFERRAGSGQIQPAETAIPSSLEEMLEFALDVARERPRPEPAPIRVGFGGRAVHHRNAEDTEKRDSTVGSEEGQDQAPGDDPGPLPGLLRPAADTQGAEFLPDIVWCGPLLHPSGYGEESRHLLLAMEEAGLPVAAQVIPWGEDQAALPAEDRQRLEALCQREVAPGFVQVVHNFAPFFTRHPQAGLCIGRTVFETDRLPEDWVRACSRMDAIWVPTEFNRATFAAAGVDEGKLAVIPECLDPAPFRQTPEPPGAVRTIAERPGFVFLSIFDWTLHKGWDVLLRAFLEEFRPGEEVSLALKVWSSLGYDHEEISRQAAAEVAETLGVDLMADGRVIFLEDRLAAEGMVALYQAVDAYVMPGRGEGWGRPYMEAMCAGLPTIGTGWSGSTAFMTPENSYPVDSRLVPVPERGWREVPTYRGHRWAEPDREHVRAQMRRVVERREEAREIGERARRHIETHFSRASVGPLIRAELLRVLGGGSEKRLTAEAQGTERNGEPGEAPAVGVPSRCGATQGLEQSSCLAGSEDQLRGPGDADADSGIHSSGTKSSVLPVVRWEGAFFRWHSLAHVNRELCLGLLGSGQVELSLVPTERDDFRPVDEHPFDALAERCFSPLSAPADVHVRHHFPPRMDRPEEGCLVLMQPWEYGSLPRHWIEPLQREVQEVWCNSRYVQEVYRSSGVPEEKLQWIPLGVDTAVFHPAALPYVFSDEPGASRGTGDRPFSFLFVGGTLHRKGFDILLEAYVRAFSAFDDVRLVVKDTGTRTVYRGQNHREKILELAADPSRPPIVYLEEDLSAHRLAGVFTAADCLVAPYRGEGFCLPVLEAMACGIPAIATAGGATDDFVDGAVGWRVPAERRPFGNGRIGEWDCVGPTWMFEISPDDLARLLRMVYVNREEAAARGAAAAARVREAWTWQHACSRILSRLQVLTAEARRTQRKSERRGIEDSGHVSENGAREAEARRQGAAHGETETSGDLAAAPATAPVSPGSSGDMRTRSHPAGPSGPELEGIEVRLLGHHAAPATPSVALPEAASAAVPSDADSPRAHRQKRQKKKQKDQKQKPGAGHLSAGAPGVGGPGRDPAHPRTHSLPHNASLRGLRGPVASACRAAAETRQAPTVSLCMIVRNEQRVLAECLKSVRAWVDEIIVVDTGSTDRTVAIAREFGARVHSFPWRDSFSAARNESIRHAAGDWILWVDADDTLPPECGPPLRELTFLAEDAVDGFILQVHCPPAPGETGMTVVDHVKLFRNVPELRFEYRIHEQILAAINRRGGKIQRTPLHVVHSGYDHSPEGQRRKRERDLKLLALDLEERPGDPFVLFNLGMTHFFMKDPQRARGWLEQCLAASKPWESTVRKVYAMLAGCHEQLGDASGARARVEEGLALFPADPELLFRAGIVYRELGDLGGAERSYVKLLTAPERGHIDSLDVSMSTYKARHNLALVYQDMGRPADAEAQWKAALESHPGFAPSLMGLVELYRRTGRTGDAAALADRLALIDPAAAEHR